MDTIAQWVEGGAPEGDPALLPKLPEAHPPFPSAPNGRHVIVQGSTRLDRATEILAILPDADAPQTTRIWAELPGGSITPLLWAYEYRRAFAHPFVFREPVQLPPGTRVASQPPLAFTLTTR
jgi:hypothetical protein